MTGKRDEGVQITPAKDVSWILHSCVLQLDSLEIENVRMHAAKENGNRIRVTVFLSFSYFGFFVISSVQCSLKLIFLGWLQRCSSCSEIALHSKTLKMNA